MANLLEDLEKLVEIHKGGESSEIIRWIPICEHYKTAQSCWIFKEKTNDPSIQRKGGVGVNVLAWIKVKIDPSASKDMCLILEIERVR
jgi:hypothetical protein